MPPLTAVTVISVVSARDVAVSLPTFKAIARSHWAQSSGATFLFDVVKAVSLMDLRVLRLHHRMGPPPIASITLTTSSELAITAAAVPAAEACTRSSHPLLSAFASIGATPARSLEPLSGVAFFITAAPAVALLAITAVALLHNRHQLVESEPKPVGVASVERPAAKPIGVLTGAAAKPLGELTVSMAKPLGVPIDEMPKPVGMALVTAKPIGVLIVTVPEPVGETRAAAKPLGALTAATAKPIGVPLVVTAKPLGVLLTAVPEPVGAALAPDKFQIKSHHNIHTYTRTYTPAGGSVDPCSTHMYISSAQPCAHLSPPPVGGERGGFVRLLTAPS